MKQITLTWPVVEHPSPSPTYEIITDAEARVHHVYIPSRAPNELEYFHELVHAWLAENVHPQLAGQTFVRGTPDRKIQQVATALRVAADWFVEEIVHYYHPRESEAWLRMDLENLRRRGWQLRQEDRLMYLSTALLWAEAIRWLGMNEDDVPEELRDSVHVLLKYDPMEPSAQNLVALANDLMRTWGIRRRLSLARDPKFTYELIKIK